MGVGGMLGQVELREHSKKPGRHGMAGQVHAKRKQRPSFPSGRRLRRPSHNSTPTTSAGASPSGLLSLGPEALPGVPPTLCRFCLIQHHAPNLLPWASRRNPLEFPLRSPRGVRGMHADTPLPCSWTPVLAGGPFLCPESPLKPTIRQSRAQHVLYVTALSQPQEVNAFVPILQRRKVRPREVKSLSSPNL